MRLSVQGCLILLLCCLSFEVFAVEEYGSYTCGSTVNGCGSRFPNHLAKWQDHIEFVETQILPQCEATTDPEEYCYWEGEPSAGSNFSTITVYIGVCHRLTHEPGGPPSDDSCSASCAVGYVQTEAPYNPNANTKFSTGYDCMVESTGDECKERGLALVDSKLGGFCVSECAHGMFNGVCLPPPEPEKECNKDSPDYRGVIVQGYGKPIIPACGDFDQCADGSPGSVGLVNGELRCIADDYGKENECAADEIFIVDQYGVICAGLEDTPEEEPTPEEPNTDTDGDGQPDEYNPDNDPNINRKQLDDLNKGQDRANKSLNNLEKIGKGTNDRLDDISGSIDDLVGLTGQINDKLQAPDGGFDISGFLNAPTMAESAQGMADYVSQTGYGQLLATLSSFPTSSNCPVYTIPATDYWSALTMDVHCQVLADYRGLFSALFMFFWSVTALFVFFRA